MINSLRAKCTAVLLLVALVPIVLLFFYFNHANNKIKDVLANEILDTAYLVNGEIHTFLVDRVKVLEVTADSLASQVKKSSRSQRLPNPELVNIIERLLGRFDSFSLLLQLDHRGRLLAAASETEESERTDLSALYKKDWSQEDWLVDSISAANASLNNLSAPLILKPLKLDRVLGLSSHVERVLPIVVPVRSQSDDQLGNLVAFIPMDEIERFLQRGAEAIAKRDLLHGHFQLMDAEGFVYTSYSQEKHSDDVDSGLVTVSDTVLASIKSNLSKNVSQAEGEVSQWLVSSSIHKDNEYLVVYDKRSSARDVYGLGWTVLIHLPVSEIFQPVLHASNDYAMVTLVIIILVVGFGVWAGTALTSPITSIIEAMSNIREYTGMVKVDGMDRKDEVGKLANAFVSFQYFLNDRDLVLRKQVKQLNELMQTRKEAEALMEGSSEAMFVVGSEGIIDRANPALEKLFDYEHGELAGELVSKLVPEKFKGHSDGVLTLIKNPTYSSISNSPYVSDSPYVVGLKKDGSEVPLAISLSPLETTDGMKTRVVIRDLTQERRYQEELRKLATVAENTNNLVVVTDHVGNVEWVNDAFEEVAGYTSKEIIGKNPWTLLKGKDTNPDVAESIQNAVKGGNAIRAEILNYAKAGQPIWLDVDIHPVYGDKGIEHFVAIETNVTDRHLMEDQLRKGRDELEQLVEVRTRDLSLALEEADAAGRAKSAFLAMMSHEIRTPINGIVGMVDLLRRSSLQTKQFEMLDVIKDSSLSLQRIIDDILDYSKIEAGKLDLEQVSVSLQRLVTRTCEALGPLTVARSVNIVFHADDKTPKKILGDPVRLRQILYNLIGNAIKFTESSGIVFVDIVVREISDEFAGIDLVVKDTGIGMTMADVDQLFKPFIQVDDSTTRRYGGTGLGLSICKRLIEMMGGFIEVESTPGEGSMFRVKLEFPVEDATSEELADLTDVRLLGVSRSENQENGLALLLKNYISGAGATVDCLSGKDEDVVQAVVDSTRAGNPYDVVLICQSLAGHHYYQTYEALRAIPEQERPRIVMQVPQSDNNNYKDVAVLTGNPIDLNGLLRCLAVAAGKMESDKVFARWKAEDESEKTAVSSRHAAFETPEVKDGLILLAEDNEVNQEVINMQLSALGYSAMIAADGNEALKLWKKHSFDLILTDCHMPERDGYELAKAIRKAEAKTKTKTKTKTHIPIIAVTANAMSEELDKCITSGMDDCLTKPVEIDNLEKMIRKWLPLAETPAQTTELVGHGSHIPVNLKVLVKLTGEDIEYCKQLLVKFRDASIPIISELKSASAEVRFDDIAAQLHMLKSSAKTVGADALAEICINMEQAGKVRMADGLQLAVSQLTDEFDRVKRYIDQIA